MRNLDYVLIQKATDLRAKQIHSFCNGHDVGTLIYRYYMYTNNISDPLEKVAWVVGSYGIDKCDRISDVVKDGLIRVLVEADIHQIYLKTQEKIEEIKRESST